MPNERTVVRRGSIVRKVSFNPQSGRAWRESKSAGGQVYLGLFDSMEAAKEAALQDIDLGPRTPGDLSKNRTKSVSMS